MYALQCLLVWKSCWMLANGSINYGLRLQEIEFMLTADTLACMCAHRQAQDVEIVWLIDGKVSWTVWFVSVYERGPREVVCCFQRLLYPCCCFLSTPSPICLIFLFVCAFCYMYLHLSNETVNNWHYRLTKWWHKF